MNTKEFSDQFDVLYNNITSNQAPGLNEYEKSVFLTKAQDELVKNYFVPEGNPHQKGFDDNQKRQIDFSMLMCTGFGTNMQNSSGTIDPRAITFKLPTDILYIINESINLYTSVDDGVKTLGAIRQVIPLRYDEYVRLMSKPYKEPVKYQAWRLICSNDKASQLVDIIITSSDMKKFDITSNRNRLEYVIRYVKRPRPIILTDFSTSFGEDISIHGVNTVSECELDPSIHEEILQRAVELAKIAWAGEPATTVQAGQRSE